MINPAGKDCNYYYQDFMRGRSVQECRLTMHNVKSADWQPKDCDNCPVPEVLMSNFNPNLVLEGTIKKGMLGFGRKIEVRAFCSKHLIDIENPVSGCTECAKERPGLKELFDDL